MIVIHCIYLDIQVLNKKTRKGATTVRHRAAQERPHASDGGATQGGAGDHVRKCENCRATAAEQGSDVGQPRSTICFQKPWDQLILMSNFPEGY
jgi:hypothetical protein